MAKTRNPQDATLRNIRALKARVRTLEQLRRLDRTFMEQMATAFTRFQVATLAALAVITRRLR